MRNLANPEVLDLSENEIEVLKNLNSLTNLQTFTISHNQITELNGLDNLKNLQTFTISNNPIKDPTTAKIKFNAQFLHCAIFTDE